MVSNFLMHASAVTCIQACTRWDVSGNLCDRLREITLPGDISDDIVNKSVSVLAQLKDATANDISLVEENRLAFESYHNSTVSYIYIHTYIHTYI